MNNDERYLDKPFTITAVIKEKVSKKTNSPYKCLVLKLSKNLEKPVFLTNSELELLLINNGLSK